NLDVNSGTGFGGGALPGPAIDFFNDVADDLADEVSGHTRTLSVMANALVDLELGPVTVYGGGGLGIANVERYINLGGFADESSFLPVLASYGIASIAFSFSPQLAVTGEYRSFDSIEDLNHSYCDGAFEVDSGDFGNHSA